MNQLRLITQVTEPLCTPSFFTKSRACPLMSQSPYQVFDAAILPSIHEGLDQGRLRNVTLPSLGALIPSTRE